MAIKKIELRPKTQAGTYEDIVYPKTSIDMVDGLQSELDSKVTKILGKDLSTNDYTTAEKDKLAGIAANANNYTHPATHPASIITQDASNRFTTDAEKTSWNAKASTAVATTSANGLMSSADKTKLDGVASGANNYTHPATHPATMITEDADNRFVTDAEKTSWNAKASTAVATTTVNGLMASTDKTKLDSITSGANNYTHPATHPPSIIAQDASNRFVTDAEKTAWNNKYTKSEIDNKFSTLETNIDWKESVNTFADIATTYPTPIDGWTVNTKDTDYTYRYNGAAWVTISANAIPKATVSVDGLFSKEDKTKLDGITSGANNYIHPATHPATMITEDANNRFVTDAEKTAWNAKASTAVATTTANGLMSSTDKVKLDGVAPNANNYIHPGSGTNPHGTTKADIGLGSAENKSSATIRSEITKSDIESKLTGVVNSHTHITIGSVEPTDGTEMWYRIVG